MIDGFEDLNGSQDLRSLNGSNGNGLHSSNGHVNGNGRREGYNLLKVAQYIRDNPPQGGESAYRKSFLTIFGVIRGMGYPVEDDLARLGTYELFARYKEVKTKIDSEFRNENSSL